MTVAETSPGVGRTPPQRKWSRAAARGTRARTERFGAPPLAVGGGAEELDDGSRLRGVGTERSMIGMPGHAIGPERDDDVGLDVGDVAGDDLRAIVQLTSAVVVAEHVELVDAECGKTVAQLLADAAAVVPFMSLG